MWLARQSKKVFTVLLLFALGTLTPACMSQIDKTVTARDVCSFVAKEMTSAVPQVPTLCVPKSGNFASIELSVFSPTDVLEGKMRRTWSTALFIVFSELYFDDNLRRICKASRSLQWSGCVFFVSDSYLSQHGGKQYQVMDPEQLGTTPNDPIHSDPSSDEWYKRWWFRLIVGQQWARSGTPEIAKSIAQDACVRYIAALKRDPVAISNPEMMPIPGCSILLVTASRADVILTFPGDAYPGLVDYDLPLAEAFGKAFDNTPYLGNVIFRGAWMASHGGETMRPNWSYDLNDLEFAWEEMSSGVRPDAAFDVSSQRRVGQTELHALTQGAASGIVLKTVDVPGRGKIMDLTNGSEWLVSNDVESEARCAIVPGLQIVSVVGGKMVVIDGICGDFKATFAGGW